MSNPTDTRLRDEDEPSAIAAGESPGRDGIAAGEPGTGEPEDDTEAITRTYGRPSRTIPLVLLAAVGGYIMMLTLGTALQLRLSAMNEATATTVYSRITSVSGILMLVAIPLIGALSDRTTSRFGRRRPWILGGYLVSLVCMAAIGTMTNHIVIGIAYVVGITAAQAGFNVYAVIPSIGRIKSFRSYNCIKRSVLYYGRANSMALSV